MSGKRHEGGAIPFFFARPLVGKSAPNDSSHTENKIDVVAMYAKIAVPSTLKGVIVQGNHFRERIRSRSLDLEKNRIADNDQMPPFSPPMPFRSRLHSFIPKHYHRRFHSRMTMEYPTSKEISHVVLTHIQKYS